MKLRRCAPIAKSLPVKPGYVVAVWRPDGSLIAFSSGGPSNADMPRTEAELERQLADAHTRIHEMIAEIDRHDELIADLQRRIQELEQVRSTQP
jgi:hypothetical protein